MWKAQLKIEASQLSTELTNDSAGGTDGKESESRWGFLATMFRLVTPTWVPGNLQRTQVIGDVGVHVTDYDAPLGTFPEVCCDRIPAGRAL